MRYNNTKFCNMFVLLQRVKRDDIDSILNESEEKNNMLAYLSYLFFFSLVSTTED